MAKPVKTPFTEKEIQQIETMSGLGITVDKIAAIIGVSEATFQRRIKYSPGGAACLLKGRAKAETNVTQALYEMAISKKCPAATIFWLKCRARWKDETREDPPEEQGNVVYKTEWAPAPGVAQKK